MEATLILKSTKIFITLTSALVILTFLPTISKSSDFQTICGTPAVTGCVGFDSSADIAGRYGDRFGILPATTTPALDTTLKASGYSSLKFTIPGNSTGVMLELFH